MAIVKQNYWNKNIPHWSKSVSPPQKNKGSTSWIKFTIGKNEYYGQKLKTWEKTETIAFKIFPLFFLSVTLAPLAIPLFFALGTYRKLGIWLREVHYNKTIKYIVNIASNSLNQSHSKTDSTNDFKNNISNILPNDVLPIVFSNPTLLTADEARRYLQTLACVSKSMQPFIDNAKLDLINAEAIPIGDIPGIDNDLNKIFSYINSIKTKLKTLYLNKDNLRDEELKEIISVCPHLNSINLSGCYNITDKSLKKIATVSNLTSLNLESCGFITDESLQGVGNLKALTSLNLKRCSQITDRGMKEISELKSLTSLNLYDCTHLTNKTLEKIAELPLRSLDLGFCKCATEEGLEIISKMKSLTSLNLGWSNIIIGEGLTKIATLDSLEELDLSCCHRISDTVLETIAALTLLSSLNLSYSNVTDKGLQELAKLKNLRTLNLVVCQNITKQGRTELVESAPWISVN